MADRAYVTIHAHRSFRAALGAAVDDVLGDGGMIRFYDGPIPEKANDPLGALNAGIGEANTLITEAPATAAPDLKLDVTGATFYRVETADGKPFVQGVMHDGLRDVQGLVVLMRDPEGA